MAEAEPVSECTAQSQAPPAAVSRCLRENPCTHFREDTHLLCPFACVLPGDFIKAERTQCIVNNFIHIFTFVWSCNCCAPSSTFRSLGNTSNLVKPTMLKKKNIESIFYFVYQTKPTRTTKNLTQEGIFNKGLPAPPPHWGSLCSLSCNHLELDQGDKAIKLPPRDGLLLNRPPSFFFGNLVPLNNLWKGLQIIAQSRRQNKTKTGNSSVFTKQSKDVQSPSFSLLLLLT